MIDTLYVVWQDSASRRYFPVGRLRRREEAPEKFYEFVYTRGVDVARQSGFEPFLAFPEIGQEYLSTQLFPFFLNRLLPTSREDYPDYVNRLGLSSHSASEMEILARSGGRRATDSIELFAPPRRENSADGQKQVLVYLFLAHGTRHMRECARTLIQTHLDAGAPLHAVHDLQNRVDPRALVLRTGDYCCVGFIPRYLLDDVWKLLENGDQLSVTVEQINRPPAPVQQRVLCRLSAEARCGFLPCSGEEFQSVVHEPNAP